MREILLEVLREPGTGASLTLSADRGRGDRIDSGYLTSSTSGKRYPIVRGIPRFAPADNYTESFGFQWNLFQDVQVDSQTGLAQSRARFDAEAGWSADELRGRWVLDAGCGAARFAEVVAARGPNLVALDFSSAVEAAARTLARFENVDIVQGSLLQPPFVDGTFDFVYCIGVAQHTPDPKAAVANVAALTKPGGAFCLTMYARQPWTKLNGKYVLRPISKRIPPSTLLRLIESSMPILFPITNALFRVPGLGKLAQFMIPVANYVDSIPDEELRYRTAVLDTFDMLSPKYDTPLTAGEVEAVLDQIGVLHAEFRKRVPINVVGTR